MLMTDSTSPPNALRCLSSKEEYAESSRQIKIYQTAGEECQSEMSMNSLMNALELLAKDRQLHYKMAKWRDPVKIIRSPQGNSGAAKGLSIRC